MSVSSTKFAGQKLSAVGTVTLGIVPAGQTWLVKTVHLLSEAAVALGYQVYWKNSAGTAFGLIAAGSLAAGGNVTISTWSVGVPTDNLIAYTDTAGLDVWVSGSKLLGVA